MSSIHSGSEAGISGYQCQQVRWYYDSNLKNVLAGWYLFISYDSEETYA